MLLTYFRPVFHLCEKPGSYFLLAKCLKTPLEKCLKTPVQVDELHLYLKCHSSIVDFQIFC